MKEFVLALEKPISKETLATLLYSFVVQTGILNFNFKVNNNEIIFEHTDGEALIKFGDYLKSIIQPNI